MASFHASRTEPDDLLLPFKGDKYDGVIIEDEQLPDSEEKFTASLKYSMAAWRADHRKGIWLKLPLDKAAYVPIAAKEGFKFHHAEREYVMMIHWLADGESRLPANASHQVGVGCVVIHEGKMLLVQEKNGPLRGTGVWKMPTGLVDAREDIWQAAEREVLEETGVKAKFKNLLCFRQAHNILFGKSDLFCVCILEPESTEIKFQPEEIAACEWKDPSALFNQPFFLSSPLYGLVNGLIKNQIDAHEGKLPTIPAMITTTLPIGFRPGNQTLYFMEPHNMDSLVSNNSTQNETTKSTTA